MVRKLMVFCVLVMGFTLITGCNSGSDSSSVPDGDSSSVPDYVGTWSGMAAFGSGNAIMTTFKFTENSYEAENSEDTVQGSLSASGNTITFFGDLSGDATYVIAGSTMTVTFTSGAYKDAAITLTKQQSSVPDYVGTWSGMAAFGSGNAIMTTFKFTENSYEAENSENTVQGSLSASGNTITFSGNLSGDATYVIAGSTMTVTFTSGAYKDAAITLTKQQ